MRSGGILLGLIAAAVILFSERASAEPVMFVCDGQTVTGEAFYPGETKDAYPAVVVCHGYGAAGRDVTEYARAFADAGFAAFAVNLYPDGKVNESTVLTEAAVLNTVLDDLKANPARRVDSGQIFLCGLSQGGVVAAYTASGRDDIRGMVLISPAFSLQKDAYYRHPETMKDFDPYTFDPDQADLSVIDPDEPEWIIYKDMPGRYSIDALSFNIFSAIHTYARPVLITHGTVDSLVPVDYSRQASDPEVGFQDAVLVEFPDEDHIMTDRGNAAARINATAFLSAQVTGQTFIPTPPEETDPDHQEYPADTKTADASPKDSLSGGFRLWMVLLGASALIAAALAVDFAKKHRK